MATYSAIANTEIDSESPVTATLIQRLRDNPLAIQEGDATAPDIAMAALASYPFAQGDLKTTTGTVSVGDSDASVVATLPGGQYGFTPQITKASGVGEYFAALGALAHEAASGWPTGVGQFKAVTANIATATTVISLGVDNSETLTATQRYVQSSPPYDLGDGEIPLFVFAMLDPSGKPISVWVAPDPPWANNGPTRTAPDVIDPSTRKAYQRRRTAVLSMADVKAGRASIADLAAARREAPVEFVEVTQATKNADMALVPHGWVNPSGVVVLVDPVSDLAASLLDLHQDGEDVGDLVSDGYIQISNQARAVASPPGVSAMQARWKVTRA